MGFYDSFMTWTGEAGTSGDPSPPRAPRASLLAGPERSFERHHPSFDKLTDEFIADPDGADRAFKHVADIADQDPYLALTHVTTLTAIVNHATTKTDPITARLADYIQKLKGVLDKIKQAVSAASYTITVGFPITVSISVTFH